ncbi:shikimate dehydrogenase family protein [Oleiharenicola lentus]|uniref:shikimate dehydrogenase family protein n=1 Tax=Oleiharenicola lentus TaxID=2508720 RepID=UPI003F680982
MSAEPVHTLADLENWSFAGTALTVIGRPVAHSLSPVIHNAALAVMAETAPEFSMWRYFKFDIAPEELPRALKLFHQKNFRGLNLTVPHKALAIEHLASSDAFVKAAGAANTLTHTATGWSGANTDNYGLSAALRQDLGLELKGADVILLGAGGAARAAAIECLRQHCNSLWIGNRTQPTLSALVENLKSLAGDIPVHGFDLTSPPTDLPANALVLNATSVGLKPDDRAPIDLQKIARPVAVYDMIYRPPQTALLRQAAALGLPTANGLSMLVHQGARSLEIWSGANVPVDVMQAAALNAAKP